MCPLASGNTNAAGTAVPLVPIEVSLAFRNEEGAGGSDLEGVTIAVVVGILRLCDHGLDPMLA